MMRTAIILCAALALAGCASRDIPAPAAATALPRPETLAPPRQACPPFHPWSDADLKILAATIAAIPQASILVRMALDWRRYYGDARACAEAQK